MCEHLLVCWRYLRWRVTYLKNSKNKPMTLAKKILTFFLIFVFILSPLDFQSLVPYSQAQSIEEISTNTIWNGNKTIENPITISSNATLTIKKGTTITFKDNTSLKVNGKLIAKGTVKFASQRIIN